MSTPRSIEVLECTLRDGSYIIDYQFTVDDTFRLVLSLAEANVPLIEIGHGLGMGCFRRKGEKVAASDEEYLHAARSALEGKASKLGMFFIPGLGTMEDVELAAKYKMDFIRIGTNIDEVEKARPFMDRAKELGMEVSSNLMKSYAVPVKDFVRYGQMADQFGADAICVVDSAGGMLPEEVAEYVRALATSTNKKVGFHGHNNLDLAIANSLAAVAAGATVVDSTLQGLGRSAGNAQSEVLVMLLHKLGYTTGIDAFKLLDIGERILKPIVSRTKGIDDVGIVSGIAKFHSGYQTLIEDIAREYNIDHRRLILGVSERNLISVSADMAREVAAEIKQQGWTAGAKIFTQSTGVTASPKLQGASVETPLQQILKELASESKKANKESCLALTLSRPDFEPYPFVRQSPSLAIANYEARDLEELEAVIKAADGEVDRLFLDQSHPQIGKANLDGHVQKSRFSRYSEEHVVQLAITAFLSVAKFRGTLLVLGSESWVAKLKGQIADQHISVTGIEDKPENVTAILSFGEEFSGDLQNAWLQSSERFLALRKNAFSQATAQKISELGKVVQRIDMRAGLAAELGLMIGTQTYFEVAGSSDLGGIRTVAGGVIGPLGAVVVDSIAAPTRVIGIADGRGGLLKNPEEQAFASTKAQVQTRIALEV